MQFQFQLTPMEEITPWGIAQGQPSLSWYGLTDGWFWIETGGQELFRYSAGALHYWAEQDPHCRPASLPYENYQVARYWEDLLERLPAALDPVPADLAALVADHRAWTTWQRKALRWQEEQAEEAAWDIYFTAVAWWGDRTWGAGHLAFPPRLALWRVEESLHVRWDNQDVTIAGIPVWTAREGEVILPVSQFAAAVTDFHNRLLGEMEQRSAALMACPLPGVEIDLDALLLEQRERQHRLPTVLATKAVSNSYSRSWDEVRTALRVIEPGSV